ncbi:MAG: arginine--tRNA ligase [Fervidicoccaceae archaeon]
MTLTELKPLQDYIYVKVIDIIKRTLNERLPPSSIDREYLISEPPENIDADFSYPLSRERIPSEIQLKIATDISGKIREETGIDADVQIFSGYLNLKLDRTKYMKEFFKEYGRMRESYGKHETVKLKVVVEHTSANPVHPLHLGHARNSCLGDTLARLLKFYGLNVETRFYVDDVGRQVAVLIYGLSKLVEDGRSIEELSKGWKIDHWIGKIYALTNLLLELNTIKNEIRAASDERYRELIAKQDELVAEIFRLRESIPDVFEQLSEKILKDKNPEEEISKISILYEYGDKKTAEMYRSIIERVLQGFKETLSKINVEFNNWDWESDLIWSGEVSEILAKARSSPIFSLSKGTESLDFSPILTDELREKLRIPKDMEIPPLVLRRSDGTTLYTTRDIAYSIRKFRETAADYVINVVGKEQMLPQAQIRLALFALGYKEYARKLIHYSYEMVNLYGFKMSGRRGKYITLDELLEKAEEVASLEIKKRNRDMPDDEAKTTSMKIGRGAVRHSLVSISPDKPIILKLEEIINFERNTGPYLQYTYARANSLLKRANFTYVEGEICSKETDQYTWKLIKKASAFPYIIYKASKELRPEILVNYLGELSQLFNKWYDTVPVLSEGEECMRIMKLYAVESIRTILKSSLSILGIDAPERI